MFDFGDAPIRTEDPSGQRIWETHLGLPAGELVTIGLESEVDDRVENVRRAQAFGMWSVQFESTQQAIAEVQKYLDGR